MVGGDDAPRPSIGGLVLLVYRECPCGRWCATGEGGVAPRCSACDGFYVPGGGGLRDRPMFGSSEGTALEARRMRCLAFVGFLTSEEGAVRLLSRVRGFLGLRDDATAGRSQAPDGRHYLRRECEYASAAIDLEEKL